MSHNIATNGFLLVRSIWTGRCIRIRHDLICDNDGDTELDQGDEPYLARASEATYLIS